MTVSPRRLVPATLLALLTPLLFAVPAQAAETGTISGTVTARPGDAAAVPYDDATVLVDRLHDEGGNDNAIGSAIPDSSGHFSVTGLPDGTYEIRTYPHEYGDLGELGYEYYDNLWAPGSATTTVQISNGGAVTLAHAIELRPIGHIVGRVVDEQGQPVPGSVNIGATGTGGYGTDVDANGYFDSLDGEWSDNLIPGDYQVSFSPEAWGPDAPQYYLAQKTVGVTAGGTTTVNLTLVERPTVTFTVRNADGSLAAEAPVRFWMRDGGGAWRSPQYGPIMTDDEGRFQVTDQADDFRLQFRPSDGHGTDVPEYWKDAYAFGDAQVVSFDGATPLHRSYDVQLGPAPTIKAGSPTITGTAQVGRTLTLDPGSWSPSGVATSVQWFAGDDPVGTGTELTLTSNLEGQWIWARVTGTKAGEQAVDVDADGLGPVTTGAPPVDFAVPTISGTAVEGQVLTAVPGGWGPAGVSLTYRWLADGVAVAGATGPTLSLTRDLIGSRIAVEVTGAKAGFSTVSRTSAPTGPVQEQQQQSPVVTAGAPTIAGTPRTGLRLTARPGVWGPASVTLAYEWLADGARISGATSSSYVVTNAVAGKRISVRVTGRLDGATSVARTSATTAAATGVLASVRPRIRGKAVKGRTLSVVPGKWAPAPVRLSYQWLRDGRVVKGRTGRTYRLGRADARHRITVRVTGRKAAYVSRSVVSRATAKVRR